MNEKRLNYYKEDYYFQLQRKDKLNSHIAVPIGIVSILFGLITYFWASTSRCPPGFWGVWFIVFFILMILSFIGAVFFLIVSYYRYDFKYLPTARDLENYRSNLKNYYEDDMAIIEKKFDEYLIRSYCDSSHHNTINNERKASFLYKANTLIIMTILAAIFTSIPLNLDINDKLYNIIYGNKEVIVSEQGQSSKENTTNSTTIKSVERRTNTSKTIDSSSTTSSP